MKDIIYKVGYDYNIEIVELEIPVDHIHMVVKSKPKICPSYIMQVVKSISARGFFKLYPDIKKKYFWGGKLWTQSFFMETIGNANDKVIRKYVQNQLKKMDEAEQRWRGGLRGALEIDINDRWHAMIQKNFSLSEDTRVELEYLLSDDISLCDIRDERRDLGGEVEVRWKF